MEPSSTINVRPPIWALIAAVVIGGAFYVYGKNIEAKGSREPATISVSAEAKASATPDVARLTFGVQTERLSSAKAATDELAKRMEAIVMAVKEKVPEKDISTEYLSLQPIYDYTDQGQIPRGFQASQSLTVTVRELDHVEQVLTDAVNAGANQVGGVQFTIDDPEAVREDVREEAIEKAREKARALADELGLRLGKLRGYNEGDMGVPPPMFMGRGGVAMDMAQEAKLEVPVGEQEVRISVTLTYEVE